MGGSEDDLLAHRLCVGGAYRRFGELTAADARAQAAELGAAGGWGPLAKVAAVAVAWRQLAAELDRQGSDATVAELEAETVERFARRLWVLPPGGSLI